MSNYAWYNANSSYTTKAVGQKKANLWGLYDMHGNVWEWCLDRWNGINYPTAATEAEAVENPLVTTGYSRVYRGGSYINGPLVCRSALRNSDNPSSAAIYLGFRVVFVP